MEKKLKKFKVSFKLIPRERTYLVEADCEARAMDVAYQEHVQNIGRDNAKDFEVSNCHEHGFNRLALFDVTFCIMDRDGNQLEDEDGNTRVFCNHRASYDDWVSTISEDLDISDVVHQQKGWRETNNPLLKEKKND
jgi:hypothetical protein